MATAGQEIGASHFPMLATTATRSKLTTTVWACDMERAQLPSLPPVPVPAASQPAPAHALRKLPLEEVAESVPDWPTAKLVAHPGVPAEPLVIVQLIPAGDEMTFPLPDAPPSMVSAKLVGECAKTAETARDWSSATSQERGLSEAAVQPVQLESTAPLLGTAMSVTTVPVLYDCEHFPLRFAVPPE